MHNFACLLQSKSADNESGGLQEEIENYLSEMKLLPQRKGKNERTNIPTWVAPQYDKPGSLMLDYWLRVSFFQAAQFLLEELGNKLCLTVLIDEVDPSRLNPLMGDDWHTLIAMLILTFPEIHWHACVATKNKGIWQVSEQSKPTLHQQMLLKQWTWFRLRHGIASLHEARDTPLFDGYGLRQHVINCMDGNGMDEQQPQRQRSTPITGVIPKRNDLTTVLDEEEGYRWLLAYMAYRHGFRVCAIGSWAEAKTLLGDGGILEPQKDKNSNEGRVSPLDQERFRLSIEDWFLNYPDQGGTTGLSDLNKRSSSLPVLRENANVLRRFFTVGHQHQRSDFQDSRRAFLQYLRERELAHTGCSISEKSQVSYKPASGLYTLWKDLGLYRDWNSNGQHALDSKRRSTYFGLAPGYFWPPEKLQTVMDENVDASHSSPGRLLQIAEHLIDRANKYFREVSTVTEALRGAVLATQALELLGAKTPTVSVEALLLKHAFEVNAECQFPGVEYHLNLQERLIDIRKNIDIISAWLLDKRQGAFKLNAEALILTKLAGILEEYGEYEEAELCQKELRSLHRQISVLYDKKQGKFIALINWPFRWYIEFVLRSPIHFMAAIIALVVLFWGAYLVDMNLNNSKTSIHHASTQIHPGSKVGDNEFYGRLEESFHESFKSIISGEPMDNKKNLWMAKTFSYIAALLGVVNLGILVSALHSKMNRR